MKKLMCLFILSMQFAYSAKTDESCDIAIIGAGVSGTYLAYRLANEYPNANICIYETSNRIGGRLLTIHLPKMPNVPVELGGMRFSPAHKKVIALVDELKLPTKDFTSEKSDNILFLRGKRIRDSHVKTGADLPYDLSKKEKKLSPWELLMGAIKPLIPNIDDLSLEQWLDTRDTLRWQGKQLHDISWQKYLQNQLSDEGYQMLMDLGYIQMISNVSIYTQLGGFLSSASGNPKSITTGYDTLPKDLAKKSETLGTKLEFGHHLEDIKKDKDSGYILHFDTGMDKHTTVKTKKIILTLTPPALVKLWEKSKTLQSIISSNTLQVHESNPLTKLFLAYPSPWWRKLKLFSGSSTTTLPLRSTFYFGTEEEAPNGQKGNQHALLLASYQGSYTPFWKSAAAIDKRQTGDFTGNYLPGFLCIEQAQEYIENMYGINSIQKPYTAAFMDWTIAPHYGAYFFWKVGVMPEKWYKRNMQLGSYSNIFIAGSGYSTQPGWVEGCLETCDQLLEKHFDIAKNKAQ